MPYFYTSVPGSSLKPLVGALMLIFAQGANSLPVIQGKVDSDSKLSTKDSVMTVDQKKDKVMVDWSSFSIGVGEQVLIKQPDTQSVLVNRVTGASASEILGKLQANGRVFLINPNGIVFGATAEVNVGALVAGAAQGDIDLSGKQAQVKLTVASGAIGRVVNEGSISALEVGLIGSEVSNRGVIETSAGRINVIAARDVTVNATGDWLMFTVNPSNDQASDQLLIEQLGRLDAPGGEIRLIANRTESGGATVINIDGIGQANQIRVDGDRIVLGGAIQGATTLNATGSVLQTKELQAADRLHIQAPDIVLNHADNHFTDLVTVQAPQANINALGDLNVQAKGGMTKLSASAGESILVNTQGPVAALNLNAKDVSLGQVSADSLTVQAGELSQLAGSKLEVKGASEFAAEKITLSNSDNQFNGLVTVQAPQANINAQGDLNVQAKGITSNLSASASDNLYLSTQERVTDLSASAGADVFLDAQAVGTAEVNANKLTISRLSSDADVTLKVGERTTQSGSMIVGGTLTLQGGRFELNRSGNEFNGLVQMDADSVTLSTGKSIEIAGRANELSVSASNIQQGAFLTVKQGATFDADQIKLNHFENNFTGAVTLTRIRGSAEIADRDGITLKGLLQNELSIQAAHATLSDINSNTLSVRAGQIDQLSGSKLDVKGVSTLAANKLTLQNVDNQFNGVVTVQAPQANINAQGALNVQAEGNATNLTASASENLLVNTQGTVAVLNLNAKEVNLGQVSAGSLTVQAGELSQLAGSKLEVKGASSLAADKITLQNADNHFNGLVTVQAPQADINAQGDLNIQAKGGTTKLSASAGESILVNTQGPVAALNLNAKDVSLGQVDTGSLTIQADQVGQIADSRVVVKGSSHLTADSLILQGNSNQFGGDLVLNTGNTQLNSSGTLSLSESRLSGPSRIEARDIRLNKIHSAGPLDLNAERGIAQTGKIDTLDAITLTAESVQLTHTNNIFSGPVTFDAETVALRSEQPIVIAGKAITLEIDATQIQQHSALHVSEQSRLITNTVNLNNPENRLSGSIELVNAVQADIHSKLGYELALEKTTGVVSARSDGVLQVNGQSDGEVRLQADAINFGKLKAESLQASANNQIRQAQAIDVRSATLEAAAIELNQSDNFFDQPVQVRSGGEIRVNSNSDLSIDLLDSTGRLQTQVKGDLLVKAENLNLGAVKSSGSMTIDARSVHQSAEASVNGPLVLSVGGVADLSHKNNHFKGQITGTAGELNLHNETKTQLGALQIDSGRIESRGVIELAGDLTLGVGAVTIQTDTLPDARQSLNTKRELLRELDVYSDREVLNPLTGVGQLRISTPTIVQTAGRIQSSQSGNLALNATGGGSIVLMRNNQIQGGFSALSGKGFGSEYNYEGSKGLGMIALNNENLLLVSGRGIEADLVALKSKGLQTLPDAVIRARLPYNDAVLGTARSLPGLALLLPMQDGKILTRDVAPFGAEPETGMASINKGISVEVGATSIKGLGGYLTVLPKDTASGRTAQVVYLNGPESNSNYQFYYDGAQDGSRIPVSYNGTIVLSPQESIALKVVQGTTVLARQEQIRSVVRTENIEARMTKGVVPELGPAKPATEGVGGISKPASCEASEAEGLACSK